MHKLISNTTPGKKGGLASRPRPVLRFPKGVDITDDVRDDLNLE